RAASPAGGDCLPGAFARSARPRAIAVAATPAGVRGSLTLRRARTGRGPGVCTRREERLGRRADLPPTRRPAARARAGSRPDRRVDARGGRGATRPPLRAVADRKPRCPDAPADARGDARLVPRPARAGGGGPVSAAGGVQRRLRAGGGRASLLG